MGRSDDLSKAGHKQAKRPCAVRAVGSLEIIVDDAQVGKRGLAAVGAGLDHPAANFGGGFVPEVVGRFENGAGSVEQAAILSAARAPVLRVALFVAAVAAFLAETFDRGPAECRHTPAKC